MVFAVSSGTARAASTKSPIAQLVAFSVDRTRLTLSFMLILGAAAAIYAASHFALSSDTEQLISHTLPWRQREASFNNLFQPEGDQIVTVIDGATPELTEQAAAGLVPTRRPSFAGMACFTKTRRMSSLRWRSWSRPNLSLGLWRRTPAFEAWRIPCPPPFPALRRDRRAFRTSAAR